MESPSRFDRIVTGYARRVIQWRWAVVAASILFTVLVGSGASKLFFDTDYRAFFSDENPQLQAFEALQNIYTKNDNVLFVLAPQDGRVFDQETLQAVEELTAEAWKLPFALRVDAVTNFQKTTASEDDLTVEDLVVDATLRTDGELDEARRYAVADPLLRDRLIDPDARFTGVNVTLQLPGEDAAEVTRAAGAARELAAKIAEAHPGVEIHLTGIAMLNNSFMEVSQKEMSTLVPIMFLAMFVIMILTIRSASGSIATMLVVTFSVVVAMGVGGFFGVGLTPPSAQAPTIIMTLAIADSVHILVTMLREMRLGRGKYDAIVESLRLNMGPVFLTSLSTIIGFLSLNFSDVPPFNHLGNLTAAGVTAAFFFSVAFLPAAVAILPIRARKKEATRSEAMERFGAFVVRRRHALLWTSAAAAIVLGLQVPQNVLDDRFVEYFDHRIEFRNATDFTAENLTGIYQIEYSLGAPSSGGISEPRYLEAIESFAQWFRAQPGVTHVSTFADVMKRLNQNMHGDDPGYYRLPDSRELAAQYLLLYEMSLPFGLDLNNQVNVDKSATRFTVTLENMSAAEMRVLGETGERWLKSYAPPSAHAVASGSVMMFSHISHANIRSMLTGSVLALVLISLLMIFALRSVSIGLLSLIPNILPTVMAFGIWALSDGMVNLGLSIVIGMTMGIVVDDSIHFLTKYLRARREKAMTPAEAVQYAFSTVGRALVVTSLILAVGFGILATSAFQMNSSMGLMTAITIVVALAIDFFFLPPLLIVLESRLAKRAIRVTVPALEPAPAYVPARKTE